MSVKVYIQAFETETRSVFVEEGITFFMLFIFILNADPSVLLFPVTFSWSLVTSGQLRMGLIMTDAASALSWVVYVALNF